MATMTDFFPKTSNDPRIPQTLARINSTNLVARWLLDGTLTDQVSSLAITRAGTWNTTSYNMRWDSELNQYVPVFTGTNYYSFTPTGFPSGASAGTICLWYKNRASDSIGVFSYGYAASLQARGLAHASSAASFWSGSAYVSSGINTLSDGLWHHIAASYNGTTITLYVDGILQASSSLTLSTTTTYGTIGYLISGSYHVGYVADCRCYSAALTAAQVLAIASFEA